MGLKTIRSHCKTCGQKRPFQKEGLSSGLHVILTLLTVGGWLLVVIPLWILNMFKPFRCTFCGRGRL